MEPFPPIDPPPSSSRLHHWPLPLVSPPSPGESSLEEALLRLSQRPQEGMDAAYPERPGEPDCAYYMRTGVCAFGINCKFNHPPNRRLASASAAGRSRGEFPERIGQPECQYYLKTGTCKFGATCKYHHPRERAGLAGRAQLNILSLPLRPGEKDCAYYMRTGNCKYGMTCKFNHPQPATLVSMPGSPIFPGAASGSALAPQPYPAAMPAWPMPPTPYLQPPRLTAPSNFAAPVLLPRQGVVSMPGWNYQGHLASQEGQQQALQASYIYGAATPQDPAAMGLHASFPHYLQGTASMRLPTPPSPLAPAPLETLYPERPGQPECHYYMRTGDCRFGSQCRFHHPRDRNAPSQATVLSPMGLPLRPGAPPCTFYNRYGFCKFGPTCKFDHPFMPPYNPPDIPVPHYYVGSSASGSLQIPSASETPVELMRRPSNSGTVSLAAASTSGGGAQTQSAREIVEEDDVPSPGAAASSQ